MIQLRIIKLTNTQLWLNDQTPELPQQSEAAENTQLGAKYIFLQIISVKLWKGNTFTETNTLLDCGSDTTVLRRDVQKLNFNGKQKKLSVTSTLSKSHNIDSASVSFDKSSISVSGRTQISVWVVQNLKIPFNRYDVSKIKKIRPHRRQWLSSVERFRCYTHANLLLHRDFR